MVLRDRQLQEKPHVSIVNVKWLPVTMLLSQARDVLLPNRPESYRHFITKVPNSHCYRCTDTLWPYPKSAALQWGV